MGGALELKIKNQIRLCSCPGRPYREDVGTANWEGDATTVFKHSEDQPGGLQVNNFKP